ncbi:MAG: 2TM domain-containing protein [Rhizobiales bacterium]|nr:2TM domain-containing protein [Hyphomicrobiales bacterium]MBO6699230.1 2TM domain-containing protein [Hyphomicrobiales bacterium]MBO6736768.1 2TM domain-containing protein [Hyphomicrobiales bacterium]MBO6912158.1 2TM domain-containing protein [Hyphomicrobiales bacterium]MBO6956992.1 2TM domain-containing protein [Hyphomicrobiales bacterium]
MDHAKARRRAEAKYSFFVHAAVYAAVMVLLVVINVVTDPGFIWFIWPLIGWGFAVVLHGLRVFVLADRSDIVDAMTERELRHLAAGGTDENRYLKTLE